MPHNNLPAPASPMIGREEELAEILNLLTTPACRLLTLTGPGGIGKTRLALEALRQLAEQQGFPNGVHFVALQPLAAPDFMLSTITDALGFEFYSGAEPQQQLLSYLREKALLLALDNVEHLLDGVGLLADILNTAPGVRILATSRERLNLREEWVLELDGLSVPAAETEGDLEAYGAVQLFLEQARRVSVGFEASDEQLAAIARICRLVEGMPLALELAAAWVRVMTCQQIAEEIENGLDILETTARNVEPRHRTMRAALDQSWRLLSDSEREVFRKLAVFQGRFSREAAAAVASADLPILTALADKSLLRVDKQGRCDLHEMLRQYAGEKLAESPEEHEAVQALHCAYYAAFMGNLLEDPLAIYESTVVGAVAVAIDDLRAAFRYAVDQGRQEELGQFLYTLPHFFDTQEKYREGFESLALAADLLRTRLHGPDETITRLLGLTLAWQAWFLRALLRWEEARQCVQESLALLQPLETGPEIVHALGHGSYLEQDPLKRKQVLQEALRCAEAVNFQWGMVHHSLNLGSALTELGNSKRRDRSSWRPW